MIALHDLEMVSVKGRQEAEVEVAEMKIILYESDEDGLEEG